MKKMIVAAALLATSALSANAADLAARPYTKAPAPMLEPVFSWTGFYLGGHVGGVWSRSTVTDVGAFGFAFAGNAVPGTETRIRKDGIFGGGQIGYNWQAGSWVFGIEADGGYMGLNRSVLLTGTRDAVTVGLRDVAYGDVTGRLGYAWGPAMLYAKGGYAVMEDPTRFSAPFATTRSSRDTVSGYTVGGGVEYKFSPNWSAKVEYLHFDFGREPSFTVSTGGVDFPFRQSLRLDTVKVGLNYMWGGPVVARY